jgi:cytochrome c553
MSGAERIRKWTGLSRWLPRAEIGGADGRPVVIRLRYVIIAAIALPAVILLGAWIGFFNVGASTGHWAITAWFLDFAKDSAVRTYALLVQPPGKLDEHGIVPAAGHFARGCAMCHGAPGEPRTPPVLRMLPQPPDLAPLVGRWTDAQLYRIVMHGIRFTGMPAWPTQYRDDEVWAMVAFLRQLPRLDAAAYHRLAPAADRAEDRPRNVGPPLTAYCASCHGEDGRGRTPLVPALAGQSEAYLNASLNAFALGERASGFMMLAASGLGPDEIADLAKHYAALPGMVANAPASPDLLARGRQIAEAGIPENNVPACASCHSAAGRNPLYPELDGQNAPYLESQLRLFRSGNRGGTVYAQIMANAAAQLSESDIVAVSAYFAAMH